MYPDTDLPPKRITGEHLSTIRQRVPKSFWERERWYRELGIPPDTIEPLSISPFAELFATAVREWKIAPTTAAVALVQFPKRVSKQTGRPFRCTADTMQEILVSYRDGALSKEGILDVLLRVGRGTAFSRSSLPPPCTEAELDAVIRQTRDELSGVQYRDPAKAPAVLVGRVMEKVRGRIDGQIVAERSAPASGGPIHGAVQQTKAGSHERR